MIISIIINQSFGTLCRSLHYDFIVMLVSVDAKQVTDHPRQADTGSFKYSKLY
jgi:hypothetical protein